MPRKPLAVVSRVLMLAGIGAAAGASSAAAAGSAAAPALTINVSAGRHAISRDIYGMNFAPARLESQLKLPVVRWGGNATTRYNYLLDTANHASDWYFENIPNTVKNPAALPGGSTADQFIGQNKRDGADSIITVPLIGWTPKSRVQACGFSAAKHGPQQSTDPYDSDCGNGVNTSGQDITGNDPADTSRRAGASFVAKWVGYLDSKYGGAAAGGVRFYQLDNEPDIWFATHRDVHPAGATFSGVQQRQRHRDLPRLLDHRVRGARLGPGAGRGASPPCHSTATAGVPVPAARPGPADGFLRAIGFGGRKVADGWNPKAWNPPAVRPAWAHQATVR